MDAGAAHAASMAALSRDNNSANEFVSVLSKYISTVHCANALIINR
jgi:hypothetical protein